MSETGVIKFHCEHTAVELAPFPSFAELKMVRKKMRELGLVGVDDHGIGFGNVSVRDDATNSFYITGSGTGGLSDLAPKDCAKVIAWDFDRNWLSCEGETIASAESLTHAAVYSMDRDVRIVMHGHSARLWRWLLEQGPATRDDVAIWHTRDGARGAAVVCGNRCAHEKNIRDERTRKRIDRLWKQSCRCADALDFN